MNKFVILRPLISPTSRIMFKGTFIRLGYHKTIGTVHQVCRH